MRYLIGLAAVATVLLCTSLTHGQTQNAHKTVANSKPHGKTLTNTAINTPANYNPAATHSMTKKPKHNHTEKIRGVNLGGWLVLEPWITPSLFEQFLPLHENDQADDFRKLAAAGINHVRIPIGYWAVNTLREEPWVQGHIPYLFKAVNWASTYNMKVMIDLHGAPGSQNGFDNSGKKGPITWLKDPSHVKRTLNALDQLSSMLPESKYPHVTSVQLVNEPANWGLNMDSVRQFYREGRAVVQRNQPNRIVAIHDAFLPLNQWEDFVRPYNNSKIILDTHVYHVFMDDLLKKNEDEHLEHSCSIKRDIERSQTLVNTITGEWSLATTDCAQWLNGFNIGARWDGTIPSRNGVPITPGNTCLYDHDIRYFSQEYREWLKRFTEIQMDTYEAGSGWFFWNFKTEREPQWSYLKGVEQGWIPKDPSKRTYSCDRRR
ncbi:glycoside hydrolase superfamily [Syncephalis plumigaleata]|nr:glycoside hydrolase superfamily [Syncephalis plumigaleata]